MAIVRNRQLYELREQLSLTPLQRSVLIGAVLGDGALIPASSGHPDARLQIEHKAAHRDYVLWMYGLFKEWVTTPPFWRIETNSWRFRTISHPELGEYRFLFYNGHQKCVPPQIGEWLDELGLAVWLMDDGGIIHRTYSISTHSFTLPDIVRLQLVLQTRWKVLTSIQNDGKGLRLYVNTGSAELLQSLIMPYVHPCMMDKLSLTP